MAQIGDETEADARGRDRPGGSIVLFAEDGRPQEVKVVRAGARPRLAVAVDYLDMEALGHDTRAVSIETDTFSRKDEPLLFKPGSTKGRAAFNYVLNLRLHKNLSDAQVHVKRVVLHAPRKLEPISLSVDLGDAADGIMKIRLDLTQSRAFFRWIKTLARPSRDVGGSAWQDVPDFDWRRGFREKTEELPPGGVPLE